MADKQIYTFTNEIDEIEVCALSAKVTVESTDGEAIVAEYENTADKPEFCAVLSGKHLTLKENFKFSMIGCKCGESAITVRLPKKVYKLLKVKSASGGTNITDSDVTAESFVFNSASGDSKVNAFFENVKIKSASGNVTVENPTDKAAKRVEVSSASGNVMFSGYKTEKFSISAASGKIEYFGASGEGDVNITSGNVDMEYADWSGDLKIGAVSGNVKVTLPKDSGINVKFDGVSGLVKTDLGGETGRFMNLGKGTNGEFGGSNKHNVAVNLVSGSVVLAAKPEEVLIEEK